MMSPLPRMVVVGLCDLARCSSSHYDLCGEYGSRDVLVWEP